MQKLKMACFLTVFGAFGAIFAASETPLNGTVTDQDGNPVEGAVLWVNKLDDWEATTGADGKFQFPVGVIHRLSSKHHGTQPFFNGNSIHFSVVEPHALVDISLYNLSGKKVKTVINQQMNTQQYAVALPVKDLAASTYIVALKIGRTSYVRQVVVQENGRMHTAKPASEVSYETGSLAKMLEEPEIIDELQCMKDGYDQVTKELTSYFGTVDITMKATDTIPPVIKILGGDTVSYAFQDRDTWQKYWNGDSFYVQFEVTDNSGVPIKQPSTNTLIEFDSSSFVCFMYYAVDSSNNQASASRLIVLYDSTVTDEEPPVFTIDPDTVRLVKGEKFFPDSGVTVADSIDKHIDLMEWVDQTDDIKTEHDRLNDAIFVDVAGTYTMTYRVMDTHMNMATATRTIIVEEP